MRTKSTMKTKNPKTKKTPQASEPTQRPIGFSREQSESLHRCASNCGMPVETFAQAIIIHGLEKLDGIDPLTLSCPFCRKTDELEIIDWTQERRDGTEYQGEAMRCNRCECVVTMAAWMMRRLNSH